MFEKLARISNCEKRIKERGENDKRIKGIGEGDETGSAQKLMQEINKAYLKRNMTVISVSYIILEGYTLFYINASNICMEQLNIFRNMPLLKYNVQIPFSKYASSQNKDIMS